jgi:hypothetical protein
MLTTPEENCGELGMTRGLVVEVIGAKEDMN